MIFGFFDLAGTKPAYDPGLDVACPFCAITLNRPLVTTSFFRPGDDKSYFYRSHKACSLMATLDEVQGIESAVVDAKELIAQPRCNN